MKVGDLIAIGSNYFNETGTRQPYVAMIVAINEPIGKDKLSKQTGYILLNGSIRWSVLTGLKKVKDEKR